LKDTLKTGLPKDLNFVKTMNLPVTLNRDGAVGVITINSPPVNALSQPVRAGLKDAIAQGAADPSIAALVIYCEGRTLSPARISVNLENPFSRPA